MKYVLMSGSFKKLEIYDEIIRFIRENLKGKLVISFVAASFETFKDNDKFVNKLIGLFKEKEMVFDEVYIIDNRLRNEDMHHYIKKSNILFLLGGDTLKQISYINKYNLKEVIKAKEKIIIGISAGAINMAEKVVLAKDESDNIEELSIYEGLGITNINIEPHCDFKNKTHFQDLVEASYYSDILLMHDNCYIISSNNKEKYYGSYLTLSKGIINYKGRPASLDYFLEDINYD